MSDNSEQHRHRCEVRFVLVLRARSAAAAHGYLRRVKQRGRDAQQLGADCADQWGKGNRGQWGDWR